MADNQTVEGLDAILRKLTELEKKGSGRVLAAIIRAQLNAIGKQMKADVDPKVKEGRKGVRSRFKNNAKKNVIQAKVGFGVGPKRKLQRVLKMKGNRRQGQGIAAQNIHWWVSGTKQRTTTTGSKNRGRMPAMQPGLARIAAAKSKGQQNKEMIKRGALQLQKEVVKLQKMG